MGRAAATGAEPHLGPGLSFTFCANMKRSNCGKPQCLRGHGTFHVSVCSPGHIRPRGPQLARTSCVRGCRQRRTARLTDPNRSQIYGRVRRGQTSPAHIPNVIVSPEVLAATQERTHYIETSRVQWNGANGLCICSVVGNSPQHTNITAGQASAHL
jgi:hypothetical protein